ncbi:MAG: arsenate reductase (glutaredoxin) [Cellvibrio sp.]
MNGLFDSVTITMITLYHNPRCSKSREALQLLRDNHIEPEIRLYLESPPTTAELVDLLKKLKMSARDLLRKSEDAYKALNLSDPTLSESDIIDAMVNHPKLIERPIAIDSKKAVVGRPPQNVLQLV